MAADSQIGAGLDNLAAAPLINPYGRLISYLRVSVTDRCDFRCVYCMAENMTFLPRDLLTLEDWTGFVPCLSLKACASFASPAANRLCARTSSHSFGRYRAIWKAARLKS